jgi:hypothetical protein
MRAWVELWEIRLGEKLFSASCGKEESFGSKVEFFGFGCVAWLLLCLEYFEDGLR